MKEKKQLGIIPYRNLVSDEKCQIKELDIGTK